MSPAPLTVYGVNQSFFTRKVTGYLDHKQLSWRWRRGLGMDPDIRAAGWSGGLPAVVDTDGTVLWDSTSLILHFDHRHPERAVLPQAPVHRFLAHVLEDFNDEWLYRPAVGTRWLFEDNTRSGGWDLARDGSFELPMSAEDVYAMVVGTMTASLPRLGTTPENIDSFVNESLKPWLAAMSAHVDAHSFFFGGRPSLADLAFYGGNAAHFVNDRACRVWADEIGPGVVEHTHRLTGPGGDLGEWLPEGEIPDTLIAALAETGRHYLPWVAQATVDGEATITFESGAEALIATTPFLDEARRVMLARYREARSPALDAVLEEAGILRYYADHLDQAGTIPDPTELPRPGDNRPYPATPPGVDP